MRSPEPGTRLLLLHRSIRTMYIYHDPSTYLRYVTQEAVPALQDPVSPPPPPPITASDHSDETCGSMQLFLDGAGAVDL